MRYPSAKKPLIGLIFLIVTLLLLGSTATAVLEAGGVPGVIMLIVMAVLLWFFYSIWFQTYYDLDSEMLYYRSGPMKGRIPISNIHKVVYSHRFFYYGNKPALDMTSGLIIRYNKYDEIYISPADKAGFVDALQKANPAIVVEEK
jgi:hypothetical protein